MIIAATMPTTSLISESSVDSVEPTDPPAATVMPALGAGAVASRTSWASSGVRSPEPMSSSTGAKAVWPSFGQQPRGLAVAAERVGHAVDVRARPRSP